jgi:hypothetical protein
MVGLVGEVEVGPHLGERFVVGHRWWRTVLAEAAHFATADSFDQRQSPVRRVVRCRTWWSVCSIEEHGVRIGEQRAQDLGR